MSELQQFYTLLVVYVIIFSIVGFILFIILQALTRGITAIKLSVNNVIHINYINKKKGIISCKQYNITR